MVGVSNVLVLHVFKKYFEEIGSGAKTVEIRKATDYWWKRLFSDPPKEYVHFYAGYPKADSVEPLVCRILRIEERDGYFHIHIEKLGSD